MIVYTKLETYSNGKLKVCPICNNGETDLNGDFCQICGTALVNKCENQHCSNTKPLPSNARFCPECGNASLFYTNKLLQAVEIDIEDFELDIDDEDLPFN